MLDLGDLVTRVRLIPLDQEEEIVDDIVAAFGSIGHGLGVDLVGDAVDLAREDGLHEEICHIVIEVGLGDVESVGLLEDRRVMLWLNNFSSSKIYFIRVYE